MELYNVILRNGGKLTIESDAASPQDLVEHAMREPDGWIVTPTAAIRCSDVAAFEVPPQERRGVRARNARRSKVLSDTY